MATINWASGVSGNFSDTSKWTGGVVPGAGDDAVITASGTYTVTENSGDIVNTLTTGAGITLEVSASSLQAIAGTTNSGKIIVDAATNLIVAGTINNSGTITFDSGWLRLGDGAGSPETIVFQGGGQVVLNDATVSNIGYTAPTLENVDNTISGSGTVTLTGLQNDASGVINANQTAALTISTQVTNAGLIETTGAGGLTIGGTGIINSGTIKGTGTGALTLTGLSSVVNSGLITAGVGGGTLGFSTMTNTSTVSETGGGNLLIFGGTNIDLDNTQGGNAGKLSVSGTGSIMTFCGLEIDGGTLTASSGGEFQVGYSSYYASELNGEVAPVTLNGSLRVLASCNLIAAGTINNHGTITFDSGLLRLGDGAGSPETIVFQGGGKVVFNNATVSNIGYTAPTLENVDNTISGSGTVTLTGLQNDLHGAVNANQASALTISATDITNAGLIEATSTGGLTVSGADPITNTGTISANGGNVLVSTAVTGTGFGSVGGYSTLEFGSTSTANTTFTSPGILQLDNSAGFTGTITNFNSSDILDLRDFAPAGTSASYSGGILTVTNGTTTDTYTLVTPGISTFKVVADGSGGSYIVGTTTLVGTSGNDTLTATANGQTLIGLGGNDTYVLGTKTGVQVIEGPNAGTDTVKTSLSYTLPVNVENLTLTAAGITGTGNSLANTITDFGATGAGDTMAGGLGNDTYIVNNAGDVVVENAGEGTDKVNTSISYTLTANVENLTLTGSSAINGTGNSLANVIAGNSGANVLDGTGGNDTLNGGAGADTYVYKTGYGANTIQNQGHTSDGDQLTIGNGSGVAITNDDQLWFVHSGNDLQISRIGTTDVITIQGWYSSTSNHVSSIYDSATGHTLTDSQVANLVSAMSAFSPPPLGTTTLDPTRAAAVDPVVAANWH